MDAGGVVAFSLLMKSVKEIVSFLSKKKWRSSCWLAGVRIWAAVACWMKVSLVIVHGSLIPLNKINNK